MGLLNSLFGGPKEAWHRSKLTAAAILYVREFLGIDLDKLSMSNQMRLWEDVFRFIKHETSKSVMEVNENTFILACLHILSIQYENTQPEISDRLRAEIPKCIRDYGYDVPYALIKAIEVDLVDESQTTFDTTLDDEENEYDSRDEGALKSKMSVIGVACSLVEYLLNRDGIQSFGAGYIVLEEDFNLSWKGSQTEIKNVAALVNVKSLSNWALLELGWNTSGAMGNTILVDMFVKELSREFEKQSDSYSRLQNN